MDNAKAWAIKYYNALEQSDGSYINSDGLITWYNEAGHHHREDGPAQLWRDGGIDWYLNGDYYLFNEWCIVSNKTDEEKMMLRLRYG